MTCVDKPEADHIVKLSLKIPLAKLYVRSDDLGHSLCFIHAGVDFQIRETFESALLFSEAC